MTRHEPCAGGVVFDAAGRLLLIQRARPPSVGAWAVPGGRCRPGETPEAACVREVAEETGLAVRVVRWLGRVQRDGPDGVVYDIDDFLCELQIDEPPRGGGPQGGGLTAGELCAGDDAAAARWVTGPELAALPLVDLLAEALDEWGCLPRS